MTGFHQWVQPLYHFSSWPERTLRYITYIWQGFITKSNQCITFQVLDFANFPLYDSWDNLTWKYFKIYTTILLEAVKVDSVARLILVTSWTPSVPFCYTQTICSWSSSTGVLGFTTKGTSQTSMVKQFGTVFHGNLWFQSMANPLIRGLRARDSFRSSILTLTWASELWDSGRYAQHIHDDRCNGVLKRNSTTAPPTARRTFEIPLGWNSTVRDHMPC